MSTPVSDSFAPTPSTVRQPPDRNAMRCVAAAFPTGLTLVAAKRGGEPVGMLANSFTSVSLDPPLVSINVAKSSSTWPQLREAGCLGISVMSENQEEDFRLLSRKTERFSGVDWSSRESGAIHLHQAIATFEVEIERELDAGDHVIVLLRVVDMHRSSERLPLIFYSSRLHRFGAA
jgi:flavin reductase (DIM6/NTAB) family NADH-FMN oxidoreductase RutF